MSMIRYLYDQIPYSFKGVLPKRTNSAFFGLLFDVFQGDFKIGALNFEIPRGLTQRSFRSRFFFKVYEKEEIALAKRYLKPEMAVLELGGCLGVVSCVIDKVCSEGTHVVVEANPNLVPILARNRARNNCEFAIEHCLVSRTSNGTFFLHDLIVGGSATRGTGSSVRVPVLTVDDLQEKHGVTFNALMCDIEGGELEFLSQNADFVRNLDVAILEIHRDILSREQVTAVEQCLRNGGLTLVERIDQTEAWCKSK